MGPAGADGGIAATDGPGPEAEASRDPVGDPSRGAAPEAVALEAAPVVAGAVADAFPVERSGGSSAAVGTGDSGCRVGSASGRGGSAGGRGGSGAATTGGGAAFTIAGGSGSRAATTGSRGGGDFGGTAGRSTVRTGGLGRAGAGVAAAGAGSGATSSTGTVTVCTCWGQPATKPAHRAAPCSAPEIPSAIASTVRLIPGARRRRRSFDFALSHAGPPWYYDAANDHTAALDPMVGDRADPRRGRRGGRAGAEIGTRSGAAETRDGADAVRAGHEAGADPGDRAAADVVVVRADDSRTGLRASAPRAARRRAPPHSGPDHQSAPGRRQGRAVSAPRLRRRPRHRRGDLRRQPPCEHAQPRPRAGLRRPALPHPGDGARGRRAEGAVLRRIR